MFLLVNKNADGEWYIVRFITNPINVKGNIGEVTYGDISKLDLETRKLEGFWTQEDIYDGMGDYKVFSHKTVEYDDENAVVRNVYHYVTMPIDDIKRDFTQQTISVRDDKYNNAGVIGKDSKIFPTDSISRSNYVLLATALQINPNTVTASTVSFETKDGEIVEMTHDEFKSLVVQLASDTNALYKKCIDINKQISLATTLEEVRAAAVWND